MKRTLRPRDGPGDSRDDWQEELLDNLSSFPAAHACFSTQPPSLSECVSRWPSLTLEEQSRRFSMALAEYQHWNGAIYRMLRPSIDLSGPYMAMDKRLIMRSFVDADKRDGRGLHGWAVSFKGIVADTDLGEQLELHKKLAELKLSASASRTDIATHLDGLLHTWLLIDGNAIERPAQFISLLLISFPTEPDTSKIVRLRTWLAEKVTDKSSMLDDIYVLIDKISRHAVTLGVSNGKELGGQALLMGEGDKGDKTTDRSNDCRRCFLFGCTGGTKCHIFGTLPLKSIKHEGTRRLASAGRVIIQFQPKVTEVKQWTPKKLRETAEPFWQQRRDLNAKNAQLAKDSNDAKGEQSGEGASAGKGGKKRITFVGRSTPPTQLSYHPVADPDVIAWMERMNATPAASDDVLVLTIDPLGDDRLYPLKLVMPVADGGLSEDDLHDREADRFVNDETVQRLEARNAELQSVIDTLRDDVRRQSQLVAPSPAPMTPAQTRASNPALSPPLVSSAAPPSMLAQLRGSYARDSSTESARTPPAMMAQATLAYEDALHRATVLARETLDAKRRTIVATLQDVATLPYSVASAVFSQLSTSQVIALVLGARALWPHVSPHAKRLLFRGVQLLSVFVARSTMTIIQHARASATTAMATLTAKYFVTFVDASRALADACGSSGSASSGSTDGGTGALPAAATPAPPADAGSGGVAGNTPVTPDHRAVVTRALATITDSVVRRQAFSALETIAESPSASLPHPDGGSGGVGTSTADTAPAVDGTLPTLQLNDERQPVMVIGSWLRFAEPSHLVGVFAATRPVGTGEWARDSPSPPDGVITQYAPANTSVGSLKSQFFTWIDVDEPIFDLDGLSLDDHCTLWSILCGSVGSTGATSRATHGPALHVGFSLQRAWSTAPTVSSVLSAEVAAYCNAQSRPCVDVTSESPERLAASMLMDLRLHATPAPAAALNNAVFTIASDAESYLARVALQRREAFAVIASDRHQHKLSRPLAETSVFEFECISVLLVHCIMWLHETDTPGWLDPTGLVLQLRGVDACLADSIDSIVHLPFIGNLGFYIESRGLKSMRSPPVVCMLGVSAPTVDLRGSRVVWSSSGTGRQRPPAPDARLVDISVTGSFKCIEYPSSTSSPNAYHDELVPAFAGWVVHADATDYPVNEVFHWDDYPQGIWWAYRHAHEGLLWERRCKVSPLMRIEIAGAPPTVRGFFASGDCCSMPAEHTSPSLPPQLCDYVFSPALPLTQATLAFEAWCNDVALSLPIGSSAQRIVCTRELYRISEFDGHKTHHEDTERWVIRRLIVYIKAQPSKLWIDSCAARSYPHCDDSMSKMRGPNGLHTGGIYRLPTVGDKRPREFICVVSDSRRDPDFDPDNTRCPDRVPGCHCGDHLPIELDLASGDDSGSCQYSDDNEPTGSLLQSQYSRFVLPIMPGTAESPTVMITAPVSGAAALADNGASVSCAKTTMGRVPGTTIAQADELEVGEGAAALASHGLNIHALRLTGFNGQTYDDLWLMHDTPNVIVTVLSEARLVYKNGMRVTFTSELGRVWHTPSADLQLTMASNGLGWLRMEPIEDMETIRFLLKRNHVNVNATPQKQIALIDPRVTDGAAPSGACLAIIDACRAFGFDTNHSVIALGDTAHRSMGRLVDYSGVELLKRFHILGGHCNLAHALATMDKHAPAMRRKITDADIKQVIKDGCGICETTGMRRPPFPASLSKRPLPGKEWTFDTMHLRKPSFQHGFKYVTRFVDRGSGPKGFKRSYGHKDQTEETHQLIIGKHRAWARPHFGEIETLKHDAHPSLIARELQDYMADGELADGTAPPYAHEWASDVEISWQHDVPAANALLRGSGDGEQHFYTAFLYREDSRNYEVDWPDGSCPATRLGLPPRDWNLVYVYGSLVKYLVHLEARDSKFDDHALPAVYRGNSRDNESTKCCWVSDTNRLISIDIGCMRIDERSIMDRMARDHPSHQPFADAEDVVTTPNFESWRIPNKAAGATFKGPLYEAAYDYSTYFIKGVVPHVEICVLLFGGRVRDYDIGCYMRTMASDIRTIHPVVIDLKVGGYAMDVLRPPVASLFMDFCSASVTTTLGVSLDCATWTCLKSASDGGPPPDRDIHNLWGIPDAHGAIPARVAQADMMLELALKGMTTVIDRGAAVWFEHPPSHGRGSPFYIPGKEDHASVFEHPHTVRFMETHGDVRLVPFDQCSAVRGGPGSEGQKPTMLMTNMGEWAEQYVAINRCTHSGKHARPTKGVLADGSYASSGSEEFAPGTCSLLAEFAYAAPPQRAAANPAASAPAVRDYAAPDDPYPVGTQVDVFWRKPVQLRGFYRGTVVKSTAIQFKTVAPKREIRVKYDLDGSEERHRVLDAVIRCPSLNAEPFEPCDDEPVTVNVIASTSPPSAERELTACAACAADLLSLALERRARDVALVVQHTGLEKIARDNGFDLLQSEPHVHVGLPVLIDIDSWRFDTSATVFAVAGASYALRLSDIKNWTPPKNEAEYLLCPQRALWRTGQELKIEDYESSGKYTLVEAREATAKGVKIWRSLWARVFKTLGDRARCSPRLCVQGTGMSNDGDIKTFHDVPRFTTIRILFCVRALPYTVDVAFDLSDAFQSTFIDGSDPEVEDTMELYFEQAPGHAVPGPTGEFKGPHRYVCRSNVAWQGATFSGRVFGHRYRKILLEAGCRSLTWDPQAYIMHKGTDASGADSLIDTLKACNELPIDERGPNGWFLAAVHVDDTIAVASSVAVADYIQSCVSRVYVCNYTPWRKVLGYHVDVRLLSDGSSRICVSAPDVLEQAEAKFLSNSVTRIKPKHVMGPSVDSLTWGEAPSADTPEYTEFIAMQSRVRSMLGLGIWLQGAYERLKYPVNMACEFMNNPGWDADKAVTFAFLHVLANPVPWTAGGVGMAFEMCPGQELSPLQGEGVKSAVLHGFVDGSMRDRNITGYVAMFMGVAIDTYCGRQALKSSGSHDVEVMAASTATHRLLPIRGLLHEIGIRQALATPLYIDSQSTVYVANDDAAARKSIWIMRRLGVIREAVEQNDVIACKINRQFNVADVFTRYNTFDSWIRFINYIENFTLPETS